MITGAPLPPSRQPGHRIDRDQFRAALAAVIAAGHRARESATLPATTPKQLALAALADADAILAVCQRRQL